MDRSQSLTKDGESGDPLAQINKGPGVEPWRARYSKSAATGQMSWPEGPSRTVQPPVQLIGFGRFHEQTVVTSPIEMNIGNG